MAIDYNEFRLLTTLLNNSRTSKATSIARISQRNLAARAKMSLGTINSAIKSAEAKHLIDTTGKMHVTAQGFEALEPYKARNAIIMAAGFSSRFSPVSYETPKGLLKVKDEILIERQIKQLHEAGIKDITVVVGYKQEQFFYLEDAFGVKITINNQYGTRNNNSSLMVVADKLSNTYICSSDNYFDKNPFELYVWKSYYSAQFHKGYTKEWCITCGAHNKIKNVTIGGSDAWYMIGHVYFDSDFSKHFVQILGNEYDLPQTAGKLWEDIFIEHIDELDMQMRKYDPPIIHEFDSIDELREFDPLFLENIDSDIFDHITQTLNCKKSDIHNIYPLKKGLTNLSCHFSVGKNEYVYRHPGVGTNVLINRKAEVEALQLAQKLGLDGTFIAAKAKEGWKISRFLPNCRTANLHDFREMREILKLVRTLHKSCENSENSESYKNYENSEIANHNFDFYAESQRYMKELKARNILIPQKIMDLSYLVEDLHKAVISEDISYTCLCHNDIFDANILVDEQNRYHLIDWEYAGMSDYAQDFGTMCVSEKFSDREINSAMRIYLEHEPSWKEKRHLLAYVGFAAWCWHLWSLVKEAEGENIGSCMYTYFKYAERYINEASKMYFATGAPASLVKKELRERQSLSME